MTQHLGLLQPAAFPCNGYFLDIGIPEDLDRAQTELAKQIRHSPEAGGPQAISERE
jgi:NDP-sugar pyrophosphorylase family protein